MQVDQGGGGQEGQPAAHDQQAAVLGQRHADVEQPADVAEVAAHPAVQFGRWRTGIGDGQLVHGQLQPLDGAGPDLGDLHEPAEFHGGDLVVVVVPDHGRLGSAPLMGWDEGAQ